MHTPPDAPPIAIFIAEDHDSTRAGLKVAIEHTAGFKIVGEAKDGKTPVRRIIEIRPHVVLMNMSLPLTDGIEATSAIKRALPNTRVIMITESENDRDVFAALGAGADGYCLKEVSTNQLAMAIK